MVESVLCEPGWMIGGYIMDLGSMVYEYIVSMTK